jgi:hypothetical protein
MASQYPDVEVDFLMLTTLAAYFKSCAGFDDLNRKSFGVISDEASVIGGSIEPPALP